MDNILNLVIGVFLTIGGLAIIIQKEADIGSDDNVYLVKGCFKNLYGVIFLVLGLAFLCAGIISM